MNNKYGRKKRKLKEGETERYPMRWRECIGLEAFLVEITVDGKKKKVWERIHCDKKFKTRDESRLFCSDKCRITSHRQKKRVEKEIAEEDAKALKWLNSTPFADAKDLKLSATAFADVTKDLPSV